MEEQVESTPKTILPHEFIYDGKLLGVRSLRVDFTSYNNFKNPINPGDEILSPDWSDEPECGKGLHWIPWGLGHEGQELGMLRPVWQVIEPIGPIVWLDGKCKSQGVRIVHTGTLSQCMNLTHAGRTAFAQFRANGFERSTGYQSSSASTGYRSSSASTGDRSSSASTGDQSSSASNGECTVSASTGIQSKAMAGKYGCIALAFRVFDESKDFIRNEMRCALTGCGDGSDGKLKANTWYQLNEHGSFVEYEVIS